MQATVERVLKVLSEENKDVRKAEWSNKEVNIHPCQPFLPFRFGDEKERLLD